MKFRIRPHLKESYFWKIVIVGIKFRVVFRLRRWQIAFMGPQSSSSPFFAILLSVFMDHSVI